MKLILEPAETDFIGQHLAHGYIRAGRVRIILENAADHSQLGSIEVFGVFRSQDLNSLVAMNGPRRQCIMECGEPG